MHSIQFKGRILSMEQPLVMGILNITPDSFYEKSRFESARVIEVAGKMIEDGADILDIGGQSTRPGSDTIAVSEEIDRVIPVLESIRKAFPEIWISTDTFQSKVAKAAINSGADIINDISAGDDDPGMLDIVGQTGVPYIAMHKKGIPKTMQKNPEYENVIDEVLDYFSNKRQKLADKGIYDWVVDPGFGFGKTIDHNYTILKHLNSFIILDRPILVGMSRKGMIQKVLNVNAEKALNGTTALNMLALSKGANILRVHDVMEARECILLWKQLSGSQ